MLMRAAVTNLDQYVLEHMRGFEQADSPYALELQHLHSKGLFVHFSLQGVTAYSTFVLPTFIPFMTMQAVLS